MENQNELKEKVEAKGSENKGVRNLRNLYLGIALTLFTTG